MKTPLTLVNSERLKSKKKCFWINLNSTLIPVLTFWVDGMKKILELSVPDPYIPFTTTTTAIWCGNEKPLEWSLIGKEEINDKLFSVVKTILIRLHVNP